MNVNQTWNCDDEISKKKERKSGMVKAEDKEMDGRWKYITQVLT